MRDALGPDFVGDFIGRLGTLDVDTVVVPGLSTAYSFTLSDRVVIAIPALPNWYRSNWSLAHELGHLALGHSGIVPGNSQLESAEKAANAFAAELLLPAQTVSEVRWDEIDLPELAQFVWDAGVSVMALKRRLRSLGITPNAAVEEALAGITEDLLRSHLEEGRVRIAQRSVASSARHFPEWLVAAHQERVEQQQLAAGTLAWMLDVDEASLEPERPEASEEGPLFDPLDELL